MRRAQILACGLLCLLASACSKKPTPGGVRIDQVTVALDRGGIETQPLGPTSPTAFSAQRCVTGMLAGLETVICEYGSREAVLAGRKASESWVATATTAILLDNGLTLLAAADRGRTDPHGKQLNKIAGIYTKLR